MRRIGLVAASAALLAACGGSETIPVQKVKVTIAATALMDNVDKLNLRVGHTILRREDGTETAVFSDDFGRRGPTTTCTRDQTTGQQTCTTDSGFQPYNDAELIDLTRYLVLGPVQDITIASDNTVPQGRYTSIMITQIAVPHERDSFLLLTDGRECEIEIRSMDGSSRIVWPVNLSIEPNESWWFKLKLDLTSNQIDPTQCADGYVLFADPVQVEIEHYAPR